MTKTFVAGPSLAEKMLEAHRIMHNGSFDPGAWPNEPEAYQATEHMIVQIKNPDRFLTGDRIRETISEGECRPTTGQNAMFVREYDGVSFHIVVDRDGGHRAVTGWPFLACKARACQSYSWLPDEVAAIERTSAKHLTKPAVRETLRGMFGVNIPTDAKDISFQ